MKRYTMPFGRSIEHTPAHPERTAKRTAANGWDVTYQVWPNRRAMAISIRMQEKAGTHNAWRPCVKLHDGEGYPNIRSRV